MKFASCCLIFRHRASGHAAAVLSVFAAFLAATIALAFIVRIPFASAEAAGGESVPAGQAQGPAAPIARLDGEPISLEDVQAEIAFQIYRRQVDIYSLLKRATEELVEQRLLAREASRRGLTVEELLRTETASDATPVRDEEIDAYIAEHADAAAQPNARERIRYYLNETRKIDRRLQMLADLRKHANFEFLLRPPQQPRVHLSVEGAPARGPAGAPVTLVHFATFSSPRSARSFGYIERLREEFPGKLRWIHRHFPNERDEVGLMAAQLATQAHRKGRFWPLHDRLFALEGRLSPRDLERIASEFDLRPVAPGDTVDLDGVKRDIDAGVHAGITNEPVLFVNGRYFSGTFPYENLRTLVEEELGGAPPGSQSHD